MINLGPFNMEPDTGYRWRRPGESYWLEPFGLTDLDRIWLGYQLRLAGLVEVSPDPPLQLLTVNEQRALADLPPYSWAVGGISTAEAAAAFKAALGRPVMVLPPGATIEQLS